MIRHTMIYTDDFRGNKAYILDYPKPSLLRWYLTQFEEESHPAKKAEIMQELAQAIATKCPVRRETADRVVSLIQVCYQYGFVSGNDKEFWDLCEGIQAEYEVDYYVDTSAIKKSLGVPSAMSNLPKEDRLKMVCRRYSPFNEVNPLTPLNTEYCMHEIFDILGAALGEG